MSDAPLPPPPPDHAAPFRRTADKIDLNVMNGFGGAFVIVAPDGTTHDLLILDSSATPAIFYSTLQTRVQIALAEIEDQQRAGPLGGFGGRR